MSMHSILFPEKKSPGEQWTVLGLEIKLGIDSQNVSFSVSIQVPEAFGPVRTLTEGKREELFVGTTRNAILQGSFSGVLTPIVQVQLK